MKNNLNILIRFPVMVGPDITKIMTISPTQILFVGEVNIPSDLTGPDGEPIAKTVTGIFLPASQPLPVDYPRDKVEKIIDDHLMVLAGHMKPEDALTFEKLDKKSNNKESDIIES